MWEGGQLASVSGSSVSRRKGLTVFVLLRLGKMRKEEEPLGNMCVVDHSKSNFGGIMRTEVKFEVCGEKGRGGVEVMTVDPSTSLRGFAVKVGRKMSNTGTECGLQGRHLELLFYFLILMKCFRHSTEQL